MDRKLKDLCEKLEEYAVKRREEAKYNDYVEYERYRNEIVVEVLRQYREEKEQS